MSRTTLVVFCVVLCLAAPPAAAQSASGKAELGRTMWRAFVCSAYAGHASDTGERNRLFKLGYDAGIDFFDGVKKGAITRDELKARVPLGVLWRMDGPSSEFLVGRVFEGASMYADELVTKRDEANEPRRRRLTDLQQIKAAAESRFKAANCTQIR